MLEKLGKKLILHFEIAGLKISFDLAVMAVAVGVTLVLAALAWWLKRGLPQDPEAPPSRRGGLRILRQPPLEPPRQGREDQRHPHGHGHDREIEGDLQARDLKVQDQLLAELF